MNFQVHKPFSDGPFPSLGRLQRSMAPLSLAYPCRFTSLHCTRRPQGTHMHDGR
jgi:hypothetical protein